MRKGSDRMSFGGGRSSGSGGSSPGLARVRMVWSNTGSSRVRDLIWLFPTMYCFQEICTGLRV